MENGGLNRRWTGVDFFNQVSRFGIGACLGGGLELLLALSKSFELSILTYIEKYDKYLIKV